MGWMVCPQISYVGVLTPSTSDMDDIWRWDLYVCNYVKMRSLRLGPNPYKKRKLGLRHGQREDHVRTERENSLQAKDWGLRKYQPCQHLDPGFPASRTWENRFLLLKPPKPANQYRGWTSVLSLWYLPFANCPSISFCPYNYLSYCILMSRLANFFYLFIFLCVFFLNFFID